MKKQKKKQKRKAKSLFAKPIFWILLLAFFLRFYKLAELFHWTLDEEYWSYVSFNVATGYHIPLIGGPVSGTGLYLGPLFVWIMGIPFFIAHGNPLVAAAIVSALGVVTTAMVYLVGKTFFGRKTGIVAALLSASSFLMVIYDRKFWNASPIPILSLLTILSLYHIARGKLRWSYLLAVVLALAFHSHMTSGTLLLLVLASWLLLRLPVRRKEIGIAVAIFLVLQLPLVLFEMRHDFLNSRSLLRFLSEESNTTPFTQSFSDVTNLTLNTMARMVYMPTDLDLAQELTLCRDYAQERFLPPMFLAGFLIASLWFLWRKRSRLSSKLLLLSVSINIFSLLWFRMHASQTSWYAGQLNEYYLLPSFPMLFLALGFMLTWLWYRVKRGSWIISMAVILVVSINVLALLSLRHSDGFILKRHVVQQVLPKVANASFNLTVESEDPCLLYGYRYLFSFFGKEPTRSYLDPEFQWLYEKRLPSREATKAVVITVESGKVSYEINSLP